MALREYSFGRPFSTQSAGTGVLRLTVVTGDFLIPAVDGEVRKLELDAYANVLKAFAITEFSWVRARSHQAAFLRL